MSYRKIYIVASYTATWPGKLIVARARLKFWNRYEGDRYSHISISQDRSLTKMYSFARRTPHNPFNAGFIQESVREGMFSRKPFASRMAVFELAVTERQYEKIKKRIQEDWSRRRRLKFNFLGIILQLLFARGAGRKNHYFCSQWTAELLSSCGIDLFHKEAVSVRPFDFYAALKDKLVYEGRIKDYYRDSSVVKEGVVENAGA